MAKLCIVSTIKASPKETSMFVNYHLNIGINHIFIFFDDPNDSAIPALKNNKAVTCISCNESYWNENAGERPHPIEERQIFNNNFGMSIARNKEFDWAIFIDHDELLYPRNNLERSLENSGADVVRFQIYEAASDHMHYDNLYDTSLFKTSARSFQIWLGALLGCKHAFFEKRYFRGHQDSKVAIHLCARIKKMGIHEPIGTGNHYEEKKTKEIILLHFDCVGFDAWKTKSLGRIAINSANGLRGNRLRQQELFTKTLTEDNEKLESLYKEIFVIPKHEQRILKLLGMMTDIKLDKTLFNR